MSLKIEDCPVALCTPGQSLSPNSQQCQLIWSNHSTIGWKEKWENWQNLMLQAHWVNCISQPPLCAFAHTGGWSGSGTGEGFGEDGGNVRGNVDRQPQRVRACLEESTHSGHWHVSHFCPLGRPQHRGINKPQYLWNSSVNFHFPWTLYFVSLSLTGSPWLRSYHLSSNSPGRALNLSESNNTGY